MLTIYIAQAGLERAATRVVGGQTEGTLNEDFGAGSYATEITCTSMSGGEFDVSIISTGTVKGQSRTIKMRGVRRASWARYALWYDKEVTTLWIVPGEKFRGPVYSRSKFHFHHQNLGSKGQVEFMERAASGASSYETSNNTVKPIFYRGLALNAPLETMASIDFSKLLCAAESTGRVLYGETTVELDGDEMLVTNADAGWVDERVLIPADGVLYIGSTTRTTESLVYNSALGRDELVTSTATLIGNANVLAPNGLQGRLTIVADNNVNIMDHILYADDPSVNPNSTDALGLIAKRHVVVETSAPNNINIFAHIIAVDGGFGVKNHDQGSGRGKLNVYGGIVNQTRNAVGTVSGSGYSKQYTFDIRFAKDPPPHYPRLSDQLQWTEWEG